MQYKTTKDIKISDKISDQVLGQDNGLNIIKKAAQQRRHVLLIGNSGTGKSMLGKSLAELLPKEKLVDVLSIANPEDENSPLIRIVPKGQGKNIILKSKLKSLSSLRNQNIIFFILILITVISPWWIRKEYGDIMAAASLIGSMIFLAAFILFINLNKRMKSNDNLNPKLLIDNSKIKQAPFFDGSGAHAGALLGDVLHDPLQSFSQTANISKVIQTNNNLLQIKETQMPNQVDYLLNKHKKEVIKQKGYLATFLDKGELNILGEKEDSIESARVLSINKYINKNPHLIKLITESGKELIVTPEHKIAINNKGKKEWIGASKLKKGKEVFVSTTN